VTDTAPTPEHLDEPTADEPTADEPAAEATDHRASYGAVVAGSSSAGVLDGAMVTIEEAEGLIVDVEVALERLEAGQYRTCEICGAALDSAALASAPTLRRCVVHAG